MDGRAEAKENGKNGEEKWENENKEKAKGLGVMWTEGPKQRP